MATTVTGQRKWTGTDEREDYLVTGTRQSDTLTGYDGNDTIDAADGKDVVNGGKGNDLLAGGKGDDTLTGGDGEDTFVYSAGDGNDVITDYKSGEDKIQFKSGKPKFKVNGSDVVITVGKGKITVKDVADGVITYIDANGKEKNWPNVINIDNKTNTVTLTKFYKRASFNLASYDDDIQTVNAAAVTHDIKIMGNVKNNKIVAGKGDDTLIGGKGADTLTGGKGADVFQYAKGDGNDIITDYEENDTIQFTSGTAKASIKGNDVIFTLDKGKITVKNAADKAITYIVGKKKYITSISKAIQYNAEGTAATLLSSYTDEKFTADSKLKNIDASAVDYGINIVANKLSNYILGTEDDDCINGGAGKDTIRGGEGNDTLIGGKGNDTLIGGKDTDVFVYNNGDGNDFITDYKEEDFIQFMSGKVTAKTVGNDVVFTLGKGKVTVKDGKDSFITYIDSEGTKTYRSDSPLLINSEGTAVTLKSTYSNKVFDVNTNTYVSDYAGSLKTIDASNVDNDLVIKGNKKNNMIICSGGDNTIYGGKGDDTIKGSDTGENLYVYNNGDGNDLILEWDSSDAVSIASGTKSGDVKVNGDTVIFTVGQGKISMQGAAGDQVTWWEDGEKYTKLFTASNVAEDADYELTPSNNLSSIVESKAIDCSFAQTDSSLSFTPKSNSTPQYTFASKKK